MDNPKPKHSYKDYLQLNQYAPNTQYIYLLYESLLPKTLTSESIDNFIREHNTQVVRSFLKSFLYDYMKVDEKKIEIPRFVYSHKKLVKTVLYFEEIKKLLEETRDDRIKLIVRMGFIPGLRVSEMVGDGFKITALTPDSIDFQRLTVSGTGKGNKDYIQPINEETARFLKAYIEKYKLKHDDNFLDINRQTVFKILKEECNDIVGKKISPHSLRASCGTYLVECNWHPEKIRIHLRHVKLDTILVYIVLARKHMSEEWKNTQWL